MSSCAGWSQYLRAGCNTHLDAACMRCFLCSDSQSPIFSMQAKDAVTCFGMQAMHTAGLVHRDVKPANIIFAEQEKRFKLIDLGACADLRAGTNYVPDEGIMDPSYCPPEQVTSTQFS